MKRILGELDMTWLKVLTFAIVSGIYTGLIMLVPVLHDTSFQDIGIAYEWWVIFAVIVVVNCRKSWEAMLKCFVFFLISQPLVYVVECLFGSLSVTMAMYYYRIWLVPTLLTIPGGFIAYYCKKQNLLGSVILGIGNTIQAVLGVGYLEMAIKTFPRHLLSAIVCFSSIIIMSCCIQKKDKNRAVAILMPIILATVIGVLAKMTGRTFI